VRPGTSLPQIPQWSLCIKTKCCPHPYICWNPVGCWDKKAEKTSRFSPVQKCSLSSLPCCHRKQVSPTSGWLSSSDPSHIPSLPPIYLFAVLGFKLRASVLLSRCSITWVILQVQHHPHSYVDWGGRREVPRGGPDLLKGQEHFCQWTSKGLGDSLSRKKGKWSFGDKICSHSHLLICLPVPNYPSIYPPPSSLSSIFLVTVALLHSVLQGIK
jgi:hypothetical protein